MGTVLNADQRRHLDGAVQRARIAAELAAADALRALAVAEPSRPGYLNDDDNSLRLALREKARQLGDDTARSGAELTNLMREVAYEQWHRLLFARFLEVNGLLRHPEFLDTALTLNDCADLADDLDEPDGWSVAARFASEILPGVFRLDDPAVQVRLATEHRLELEKILLSLPSEVFVTEDALGWVYQFWQTAEKKRVNESGAKIGGADLSPVTQLFTENYMVRFLLENSLGAWWAARHPDSPLVEGWDYLRRLEDGTPAAGSFDEWPASAAEITVVDPCCGSGHFLVAMFGMLWRMRAEEEGLSPTEAQDAVLRDNLHGLELDPRCVQIAMFNVVLEAWKAGGGWRQVPTPKIACSGVAARGSLSDWLRVAGTDEERIRDSLARLHEMFLSADDYGSLLDPRRVAESSSGEQGDLFGVDWDDVASVLERQHGQLDPAAGVLGDSISAMAGSASMLSRRYHLCATNVPYRSRVSLSDRILRFIDSYHPDAGGDLATAFVDRCFRFATTCALVTPQSWLFQPWYTNFRRRLLETAGWRTLARLGSGAFSQIGGEVVNVALVIADARRPGGRDRFAYLNLQAVGGAAAKADASRTTEVEYYAQSEMLNNPDARVARPASTEYVLLADRANSSQGICTGDYARFGRHFWELPAIADGWERQQSTVASPTMYGGREWILLWEGGGGTLRNYVSARLGEGREGSWIRGMELLGKRGVVISQSGDLKPTLYNGELLDNNAAAIVPDDEADLPALWAFCSSDEYRQLVRNIDSALKVTNRTLVKVPFDIDRWRKEADQAGALPEPWSDDPTQWLFAGRPEDSTAPLQVALARLLGYEWPDQKPDELDQFADRDGIAALQSLPGEPDLVTRLRELLAAAYGAEWSSAVERTLVTAAGGKNGRLEDWVRDTFFAQHVKVFDNRPFLWHIWDGRKDGFSAIVNYHRLDHKTLEKLTFTSLGAWIERQRHEAVAGRAGADARLAAGLALQEKLKLILDGAPPYDVYVRWKELHEQPIGWNPDLNDGVRLNIRPFVTAGVLRSKVNVHWKKDRGANLDGTERLNDLHPTLEERREARRQAGVRA